MKVLTKEDNANFTATLDSSRKKLREARIAVSTVDYEYNKINNEVKTMKSELEELKKIIDERTAAGTVAAKTEVAAAVAAPAAPAAGELSVEELQKALEAKLAAASAVPPAAAVPAA
jgi:uncharacterized coiled-coil DUF342 family protein